MRSKALAGLRPNFLPLTACLLGKSGELDEAKIGASSSNSSSSTPSPSPPLTPRCNLVAQQRPECFYSQACLRERAQLLQSSQLAEFPTAQSEPSLDHFDDQLCSPCADVGRAVLIANHPANLDYLCVLPSNSGDTFASNAALHWMDCEDPLGNEAIFYVNGYPFLFERCLAKSDHTEAWLCREPDKPFNPRVVVKRVTERAYRNLEREFNILRTLEARGVSKVPRVLCSGECDVRLGGKWVGAMVTDRYGEPLTSIVSQQQLLTEAQLTEYGCQIAEVLSRAHAIGVVNRDVKPAHIICFDTNQVTLIDWGLAAFKGYPYRGYTGTPPFSSVNALQEGPLHEQDDFDSLMLSLLFLWDKGVSRFVWRVSRPFSLSKQAEKINFARSLFPLVWSRCVFSMGATRASRLKLLPP